MLGTSLRSLSPETLYRLRELVAKMGAEQSEFYKEIENKLINVAGQCDHVVSVIKKLKEIRCKRQFTLEEIAERTSITPESLWRLENSPLANPQVHTLQRYALALGYELKLKVVQKKKRRERTALKKTFSTKKGNCDEQSSEN
jgi:DNA-binding phage protein